MEKVGMLIRPYEPFFSNQIPKGTECLIVGDNDDIYTVKFPNVVGYSGTFRIKKSYVKIC